MDACQFSCETNEGTIVYTSFPQIDELCCVICEIDFIEVQESSSPKSNFHWQTMKCRLLIHLIPDVIASPVSGTERFIFVVSHKSFFQTGKLEQSLKKLRLVYQGLRPVSPELYKTCLIYTIQTKIAPLWNKVGQYLLQGKDFYNSIEGNKAIKLDIIIEGREIYLKLHALKVKISHINLENYLPPSVLSQFLAAPNGYIDFSHYNSPSICVLPSLKKGKLLSVSKEIPTCCALKDYDQIRRHWKNMYGYFLPKNKDGIIYYEIKFPVPKTHIFTYPDLCVTYPLIFIPNKNTDSMITQFLSDFLSKLPIICAKQLQISKHTPFYEKAINTNILCDRILRSKELNRNSYSRCNDPLSSKQLESSTKSFDELTTYKNAASTESLKAQLAKIHQLHNTYFNENAGNSSSSKDINDIDSKITQTFAAEVMEDAFIGSQVTKDSNNNIAVLKEGTISKYFKIQKTLAVSKPAQGNEQRNLRLREKLSNISAEKNSKESLQEVDQNVNVEAMAKRNQLHQVQNSVLSDWLKRHSIPHNIKGKKTDLINKVLCHIKNTQVLQQFRV